MPAASDSRLFEDLFDRHAPELLRYCFRRMADAALAEDLVSVVFTRRRDAALRRVAAALPPETLADDPSERFAREQEMRAVLRALELHIADATARPDKLTQELRDAGVRGEIRLLPVPADQVGYASRWATSSSGQAVRPGRASRRSTGRRQFVDYVEREFPRHP